MKIACIDATAQQRLQLKGRLEAAFENCRNYLGHVEAIALVPASIDEISVQKTPDVCVTGPGMTLDQAAASCIALRQHFESLSLPLVVPVFVIVAEELYNLRTLRRFEDICAEVFHCGESQPKMVHKILGCIRRAEHPQGGQTVTVSGVKGGVGATSVVAALAHAAQALGKSAVVADLSASGSISTYSGAVRSSSPDFAEMLQERRPVDRNAVIRSVVTAPNGIDLLLPPGLDGDIREVWLHDRRRFETTLEVIAQLQGIYDLVLIDLAAAEGILPYALQTRSNSRLLISADEPASVHLLGRALDELGQIPGKGRTYLLINSVGRDGLDLRDINAYLASTGRFDRQTFPVEKLHFDSRGRDWIGTGNSFYTEGSGAARRKLERLVRLLTNKTLPDAVPAHSIGPAARLIEWFNRSAVQAERSLTPRFIKALPEPAARTGGCSGEVLLYRRPQPLCRPDYCGAPDHQAEAPNGSMAEDNGSQIAESQ